MSPPRKYPIPNQDLKHIKLKKDQCLTADVPPFLPGNKSLRNEENDDNPETIDTSHTEKDDMSHTNQDDSIVNVKDMKNTDYDNKYKEDTLKYQDGKESVVNPEILNTSCNESVINITKETEALIEGLMSMNFKNHVIKYVININTSCGEKMIEL